MVRYQEAYPSQPLVRSADVLPVKAAQTLTLEYFEIPAAQMPEEVYEQHHILLNLRTDAMPVEHWRDQVHQQFSFEQDHIVVTPAGKKIGWHWHDTANTIVVTIDPATLSKFARSELGLLLEDQQLRDVPLIEDRELIDAAKALHAALDQRRTGYEVIYEALARVFLVTLLEKYGVFRDQARDFPAGFSAEQYGRVLEFIRENYSKPISVEDIARSAGLSRTHFSRLFRHVVGQTPYRFLMSFRVERAQEMMQDKQRGLAEIAFECGFSDQAHLSRSFSKETGQSPSAWRQAMG
ncbi:MAG: AraC family transcriptional regulator [Pseudomonadota bacterium]